MLGNLSNHRSLSNIEDKIVYKVIATKSNNTEHVCQVNLKVVLLKSLVSEYYTFVLPNFNPQVMS